MRVKIVHTYPGKSFVSLNHLKGLRDKENH